MMTAFQTHAWNGGTCTDGINEFTCICPSGFTEPKCKTNTDECDPIPCLNGGTCNDELDGFSCNCPVGYSGDRCEINDNPSGGSSCEDEISLLADGFIVLIQMRMALELHLGVTMGETYPVEAPGTLCWYRSKNGGLDMHGGN
jgi:hypothetical protein